MVNSGVNAKRTESNGEHKCCLERIGVLQDVNDGCPMHYGTAWWPLDRRGGCHGENAKGLCRGSKIRPYLALQYHELLPHGAQHIRLVELLVCLF